MALGPTLAVTALSIGWMAGGLVVVESLFGFPGIGRLLVFAIQNRDVPLLQAIALIAACLYAVDGDSLDWGYGELGMPSFTTEVGGGSFFPSYTQIDGMFNLNKGALIYQAKFTLNYATFMGARQ